MLFALAVFLKSVAVFAAVRGGLGGALVGAGGLVANSVASVSDDALPLRSSCLSLRSVGSGVRGDLPRTTNSDRGKTLSLLCVLEKVG
jgi:hypothetical protein